DRMPAGIALIRGDVILPRPAAEPEFLDEIHVRQYACADHDSALPKRPARLDGGQGEVLPTVRQRSKYSDRRMIGKHPVEIQRNRPGASQALPPGEFSGVAPTTRPAPVTPRRPSE